MNNWSRANTAPRAPIPLPVRRRVLARDGARCQIRWDAGCTVIATEIDHIIRSCDGGSSTDEMNLRASCAYCNRRRNEATRRRPASKRRPQEPVPGLKRT